MHALVATGAGGTRREGPEPHQKVDRLNDVEKHFVLAVADPLLPPRHCVSDSCRDVGHGLQLVALLSDEPGQPGQASRGRHVRLEREREAHSFRILPSVV